MGSFKVFLKEFDLEKIDTKLDYHDELNPAFWNGSSLKDEVKKALNKIAQEFIEYLDVTQQSVTDIIITGSSCGYNWTKLSDIDLHLVIDFKSENFCPSCVGDFIADCFQAKKTLWNSTHDVTIFGFDVELYAQDAAEKHIAPGVYSLKNDKWIQEPVFNKPSYNSDSVKMKAGEIMDQIDNFIETLSDDIASIEELKEKIRKMRRAGLQTAGEYSVENLAFKTLRNNGYLEKLSNYLNKIKDKSLSIS